MSDYHATEVEWSRDEARAATIAGGCWFALLLVFAVATGWLLAAESWWAIPAAIAALMFARFTGDEWRAARAEREHVLWLTGGEK